VKLCWCEAASPLGVRPYHRPAGSIRWVQPRMGVASAGSAAVAHGSPAGVPQAPPPSPPGTATPRPRWSPRRAKHMSAIDGWLVRGEPVVFTTTKPWAVVGTASLGTSRRVLGAFAVAWAEPHCRRGPRGFSSMLLALLATVER
jgi:hypothetical protein